jgi:hypothetical protein
MYKNVILILLFFHVPEYASTESKQSNFVDNYAHLIPAAIAIGSGLTAMSCAYFWHQSFQKEKNDRKTIAQHDHVINELDWATRSNKPISSQYIGKIQSAMEYVGLSKEKSEELEKKIHEYNLNPKAKNNRAQILNIVDAQLGKKARATLQRIYLGDFVAHKKKSEIEQRASQTKRLQAGTAISGAMCVASSAAYWYKNPFAWLTVGLGVLSLAAASYFYKSKEAEERAKILDDAQERIRPRNADAAYIHSITGINRFSLMLKKEREGLAKFKNALQFQTTKQKTEKEVHEEFEKIAQNIKSENSKRRLDGHRLEEYVEAVKDSFRHIQYPYFEEFRRDYDQFNACDLNDIATYNKYSHLLTQHIINATGADDNILDNLRLNSVTDDKARNKQFLLDKQQRKTAKYKLALAVSSILTGLCFLQAFLGQPSGKKH